MNLRLDTYGTWSCDHHKNGACYNFFFYFTALIFGYAPTYLPAQNSGRNLTQQTVFATKACLFHHHCSDGLAQELIPPDTCIYMCRLLIVHCVHVVPFCIPACSHWWGHLNTNLNSQGRKISKNKCVIAYLIVERIIQAGEIEANFSLTEIKSYFPNSKRRTRNTSYWLQRWSLGNFMVGQSKHPHRSALAPGSHFGRSYFTSFANVRCSVYYVNDLHLA